MFLLKVYRCQDSKPGPLVLKATAVPTEPQQLPPNYNFLLPIITRTGLPLICHQASAMLLFQFTILTQSPTVLHDAEFKSCPIVSKSCLHNIHVSFTLIDIFSKQPKATIFQTNFAGKFVAKNCEKSPNLVTLCEEVNKEDSKVPLCPIDLIALATKDFNLDQSAFSNVSK